jgi:hypothetical protein
MKNEALADEYCKNEIPFDITECGEKLYTENDLKQAFIAGNRSKEEQLKTQIGKMKFLIKEIYEEYGFGELVKIRNDLPTEIQEIIGDIKDA